MQTRDEFAATVVENLPASHLIQAPGTALPAVGAYVPAGQETQKSAEYAPAVVEYLPASQDRQAVMLSLPLYGANVPGLAHMHTRVYR